MLHIVTQNLHIFFVIDDLIDIIDKLGIFETAVGRPFLHTHAVGLTALSSNMKKARLSESL